MASKYKRHPRRRNPVRKGQYYATSKDIKNKSYALARVNSTVGEDVIVQIATGPWKVNLVDFLNRYHRITKIEANELKKFINPKAKKSLKFIYERSLMMGTETRLKQQDAVSYARRSYRNNVDLKRKRLLQNVKTLTLDLALAVRKLEKIEKL